MISKKVPKLGFQNKKGAHAENWQGKNQREKEGGGGIYEAKKGGVSILDSPFEKLKVV